jgi:NADP-dependent 3-hydroxy acid dehydrogenase YdfG
MIDINVKGLLYVSKAIIPQMIERKSGHIINIGSIAGKEVSKWKRLLRLKTCC